MAVPKCSGFLMIVNYRALKQLIEQAAMVLPRLEGLGMLPGAAAAFLHPGDDSRVLDVFRSGGSHCDAGGGR